MTRTLKSALRQRLLLAGGNLDAALDTQRFDLRRDFFGVAGMGDLLCLSQHARVKAALRDFLHSGADVLLTPTRRANPLTLREHDLEDLSFALNLAAAEACVEAVDEEPGLGRRRFVLGVIEDRGWLAEDEDVQAAVREQAEALLAGGVDAISLEIWPELGRLKAAFAGAQRAVEAMESDAPLLLLNRRGSFKAPGGIARRAAGLVTLADADGEESPEVLSELLGEGVNLLACRGGPAAVGELDRTLRTLAPDRWRPVEVRGEGELSDELQPASSWQWHSPAMRSQRKAWRAAPEREERQLQRA